MKTISKKGQLTLFVIIGIVIIITTSSYLIIQNSSTQKKYDPEISIIKDNLLDCFKNNYENALERTAYQGGFIEKPNSEILEVQTIFLPYFYYKGKNLFPTIKIIEKELGKASQNLIGNCVIHYPDIASYSLNHENFDVFAKIEEKQVIFKTNMKLTIDSENQTTILDFNDFEVIIESELYNMYEIAKVIVNQANNQEQEWIDITEIYEEAKKRDLNISILGLEENTATHLFIIETNKPTYPPKFQFLNKYNLEEIGFPDNLNNE